MLIAVSSLQCQNECVDNELFVFGIVRFQQNDSVIMACFRLLYRLATNDIFRDKQ